MLSLVRLSIGWEAYHVITDNSRPQNVRGSQSPSHHLQLHIDCTLIGETSFVIVHYEAVFMRFILRVAQMLNTLHKYLGRALTRGPVLADTSSAYREMVSRAGLSDARRFIRRVLITIPVVSPPVITVKRSWPGPGRELSSAGWSP